jgi:Ca2+-binding RTX toxin-like protein
MTTVVTVPGASGTFIPNPYSTPSNLGIAQQISSMLFAENANNTLFVQNSDENPGPVPDGSVGEIAVTLPGGGAINVPAGYSVTAIENSVAGPVTVSGGGSLFAGNTPITYYGAASPDLVLIAVNNGNDLLSMPVGSTYSIAFGNGNDTVYANGSGTVTGGDGHNIFFVGSPGSQNDVNSYGNADTIVAGQGSVTVSSSGSDPLVFGGAGQLVYLGGAPGNPTITGGAGQETLFAGAGQDITYTDGTNTTTGANILAAGAGNETLDAGAAQYGVQLAAGSGSVDMIGSQGNDVFYGGSGAATMTGNGGADAFIFGNTAGHTGGTDIITDFNGSDNFVVAGYGANAAQNALNAATISSGSTTVALSDNTTITFIGVTNPGGIHNQSF